jgi:hypothetical protein
MRESRRKKIGRYIPSLLSSYILFIPFKAIVKNRWDKIVEERSVWERAIERPPEKLWSVFNIDL